jgi:hypothetical protein
MPFNTGATARDLTAGLPAFSLPIGLIIIMSNKIDEQTANMASYNYQVMKLDQ